LNKGFISIAQEKAKNIYCVLSGNQFDGSLMQQEIIWRVQQDGQCRVLQNILHVFSVIDSEFKYGCTVWQILKETSCNVRQILEETTGIIFMA